MALCVASSLLERRGFDARNQMNPYVNGWRHGNMSSNGRCFDIGMTLSNALARYLNTHDPMAGSTDPSSAGNGSLIRRAPVAMAYAPDEAAVRRFAGLSSATTHAAPEALDACELFGAMRSRALSGAVPSKDALLAPLAGAAFGDSILRIATGGFIEKSAHGIRGSGYCVDSLEAALWCFFQADTFEAAVLRATNLGQDADTTAAITGQIAGAYDGIDGIAAHGRERLVQARDIDTIAQGLYRRFRLDRGASGEGLP